jgi:hypothetical protein
VAVYFDRVSQAAGAHASISIPSSAPFSEVPARLRHPLTGTSETKGAPANKSFWCRFRFEIPDARLRRPGQEFQIGDTSETALLPTADYD